MKNLKISFVPVTNKNREIALSLTTLDSQKNLCESAFDCLAEADQLALWRPVIIYMGDTAVGFAMYGVWADEGVSGRVWLDRFFIHKDFQGLGYARLLLTPLMAHITSEYSCNEIYLSVFDNNAQATSLYKKLGFSFNGEFDFGGEKVMVKYFGAVPETKPLLNNYPWIEKFMLSLPSATTDFKIEWHWDRFLIKGKMFAGLTTPHIRHKEFGGLTILTLKCDSDMAEFLQQKHDFIKPALFMDHKTWVSVILSGDTPVDVMKTLIMQSYVLVLSKLTREAQMEIKEKSIDSPFWTAFEDL